MENIEKSLKSKTVRAVVLVRGYALFLSFSKSGTTPIQIFFLSQMVYNPSLLLAPFQNSMTFRQNSMTFRQKSMTFRLHESNSAEISILFAQDVYKEHGLNADSTPGTQQRLVHARRGCLVIKTTKNSCF